MKKVKFIIEEIVSQEFELELDESKPLYDQIRDKYRNGEIVVEDPKLTAANVMIDEDNDNYLRADWSDLHI